MNDKRRGGDVRNLILLRNKRLREFEARKRRRFLNQVKRTRG